MNFEGEDVEILQVLNGCIKYGSFDFDGDDDGWENCPT